tara:strand:- start:278 stop:403 length:126 start_codon:yes stop_codon:yes gene_type:complete
MIDWKDIRKRKFPSKTKNKKTNNKFVIDFLKIHEHKGKVYE